jgi:hypothetical protein
MDTQPHTSGSKAVFRRFGRARHLRIASAADLITAVGLDEALWVAVNAPVATFREDATFLALLDHDANGRVLPHEFRTAVRWLLDHLADTRGPAGGDAVTPPAGRFF